MGIRPSDHFRSTPTHTAPWHHTDRCLADMTGVVLYHGAMAKQIQGVLFMTGGGSFREYSLLRLYLSHLAEDIIRSSGFQNFYSPEPLQTFNLQMLL